MPQPPVHPACIERSRPEKAAELVDLLTNPQLESVWRAAVECNLDRETAHNLLQRLKTRYEPVYREVVDAKTSDLLRLTSANAHRLLSALEQKDLSNEKAKDIAIAAGIMIDKRQLLSGEPTQIISEKERRHLDELAIEVLREAKLRNLEIDVDPSTQKTRILDRTFSYSERTQKTGHEEIPAQRGGKWRSQRQAEQDGA